MRIIRVTLLAAAALISNALISNNALWGQASALLPNAEVLKLASRTGQLVESTAIAIPDLNRASAPLQESIRQALANLRSRPNHTAYTYGLLNALHGYESLANAVNKPFPLAPEVAAQFVELKGSTDRLEVHFRALLESAENRLRSPDRDNLRRYMEDNQKLSRPDPTRPRVVFFGDSITDFWRLNEYFPGKDYVNRGISGQVTSEMLGRMKADVLDLKPRAMVILAGTNDLGRGTPLTVIENNYISLAELARLHGVRVIFASMLPVSDYHKDQNPDNERSKLRPPAQILILNDWLKRYCAANNCLYLDYFTNLVDNAGMLRTDLADDGLHPNAAGYRLMAPLAQAAIDMVIAAVPEQPAKKRRRLF